MALPGLRTPPPAPLRHASTAALILAVVVGLYAAWAKHATGRRQRAFDALVHAQARAGEIRTAYNQLAEQGALLKARLEDPVDDPDELKGRIIKLAAKADLKLFVTVSDPRADPDRGGLRVATVRISGTGKESGLVRFLLALDRLPAITELESLRLRGVDRGEASLRLTLTHLSLSGSLARRLKAFVAELPAVAALPTPSARLRGGEPVFLPSTVSEEEALQGWPKIMLLGFASDKALFHIDGRDVTLVPGDVVADDITYSAKGAVNQAVLVRERDGAEILLTVGSTNFSLKPSRFAVRQMNEFVLTLQKRTVSDLIARSGAP